MLKYLKTAPAAARIEFAAGGLWIVAGLASGMYTGILWTVDPELASGRSVVQPILTLIALGILGGLPSLWVGAILHSNSRARIWTGAVIAIILAVVYVGVVSWATIENLAWAASHPGGSLDIDFLAIGILVVVAGVMHAISGVVGIRGLLRPGHLSRPRPAGA